MKTSAIVIAAAAFALLPGTKSSALAQDAHNRHCQVDYNHKAHHYNSRGHHHFCPGGPHPGHGGQGATYSRATIMAVQRELDRRGFYHHGHPQADGVVGPETRDAIKHFQKSVGMRQTGVITHALLESLRLAN